MTEIWYRLNTVGEKKLFNIKSLIDGAIIPGHLIAFYDGTMPNFIKDLNLPFLIDPMTYVWGKSPTYVKNGSDMKKSFLKYVEKLDCNLARQLGVNNISITGVTDHDLSIFTNKIIQFQKLLGEVKYNPRSKSLSRIRNRFKNIKDEPTSDVMPKYLIPPYFQFSNLLGTEYDLTVKAAQMAKTSSYCEEEALMPCLHMNRDILYNKTAQMKVVQDFKDYSQVIVWINNFDERLVSNAGLSHFVDLIESFKEHDVNVLNLYGSYFSGLMNYHDLYAFSSGIAISHRKDADAMPGGGGMPLRYYEPSLKMELVNDEVFRLYADHPHLFTCDCSICAPISSQVQTLSNKNDIEAILDPFFLIIKSPNGTIIRKPTMYWRQTRTHFLYQRRKELQEISSTPPNVILANLKSDYDYFMQNVDFNLFKNLTTVEHLKKWHDSA